MKTIRTAGDTPLFATQIGDLQKGVMLITTSPPAEFKQIDGTYVIVEAEVYKEFKQWMATELVQDSADALGIHKARAGRIRQGLGVTKFSKPGTSRTTLWRQTKEKKEEE